MGPVTFTNYLLQCVWTECDKYKIKFHYRKIIPKWNRPKERGPTKKILLQKNERSDWLFSRVVPTCKLIKHKILKIIPCTGRIPENYCIKRTITGCNGIWTSAERSKYNWRNLIDTRTQFASENALKTNLPTKKSTNAFLRTLLEIFFKPSLKSANLVLKLKYFAAKSILFRVI